MSKIARSWGSKTAASTKHLDTLADYATAVREFLAGDLTSATLEALEILNTAIEAAMGGNDDWAIEQAERIRFMLNPEHPANLADVNARRFIVRLAKALVAITGDYPSAGVPNTVLRDVERAWEGVLSGAERRFAAYRPEPGAPAEGDWDRSGDIPRWSQDHRRLVEDALWSWVGWPSSMRIHFEDERNSAPQPDSGSGKKMRAQAAALMHEIEANARPIPDLYRSDSSLPTGITSWSERKGVAKRWHGDLYHLPAGGTRGIRVGDYIRAGVDEDEQQWLLDATGSPLQRMGKVAMPDDENWWYHTGDGSPMDYNDPSKGWVHLGTFRAAEERRNIWRDRGLYRVRISPRAPANSPHAPAEDQDVNRINEWIATGASYDEHGDPHIPEGFAHNSYSHVRLEEALAATGFDPARHDAIYYRNFMEDKGSVSVMVPTSAISEVEFVNQQMKLFAGREASDYRGQHAPPEDGPPLHDLTGGDSWFPDDVYVNPQFYVHSRGRVDQESIRIVQQVRGNPNAMVTIYRSLPPTVDNPTINPGDWVALSETYAREHGMDRGWDEWVEHPVSDEYPMGGIWERNEGDWPVVSAQVPAHTVRNGGNDLIEWGYWGSPLGHVRVSKTGQVDSLGDLIDHFARDNQDLFACYTRSVGRCRDASEKFAGLLRDNGYRGMLMDLKGLRWSDSYDADSEADQVHTVVVVDGEVIDWTARQFWDDVDYPLIEPLSEYLDRWDEHAPGHHFGAKTALAFDDQRAWQLTDRVIGVFESQAPPQITSVEQAEREMARLVGPGKQVPVRIDSSVPFGNAHVAWRGNSAVEMVLGNGGVSFIAFLHEIAHLTAGFDGERRHSEVWAREFGRMLRMVRLDKAAEMWEMLWLGPTSMTFYLGHTELLRQGQRIDSLNDRFADYGFVYQTKIGALSDAENRWHHEWHEDIEDKVYVYGVKAMGGEVDFVDSGYGEYARVHSPGGWQVVSLAGSKKATATKTAAWGDYHTEVLCDICGEVDGGGPLREWERDKPGRVTHQMCHAIERHQQRVSDAHRPLLRPGVPVGVELKQGVTTASRSYMRGARVPVPPGMVEALNRGDHPTAARLALDALDREVEPGVGTWWATSEPHNRPTAVMYAGGTWQGTGGAMGLVRDEDGNIVSTGRAMGVILTGHSIVTPSGGTKFMPGNRFDLTDVEVFVGDGEYEIDGEWISLGGGMTVTAQGREVAYHRSKVSNRESIQRHGLQADRSLDGANSRVYVDRLRQDPQVRMDTGPRDLWEVDFTGLDHRPDPELPDRWVIIEEDVPPERLRLVSTTEGGQAQVFAKQAIAKRVWYRIASDPSSMLQGDSYVHLGTFEAARQRTFSGNMPIGSKMYRVELAPRNPLGEHRPISDADANEIHRFDEVSRGRTAPALPSWTPNSHTEQIVDELGWTPEHDAVYYLNEFESRGSVSVMVRPSAIVSVSEVGEKTTRPYPGHDWEVPAYQWDQGEDLKVAKTAQGEIVHSLPMRHGTYYRVHPRGRPFSPADATSKVMVYDELPSDVQDILKPLAGYSSFANPLHLVQYVDEMGWAQGEDEYGRPTLSDPVIRFEGELVGEGYDGEPVVRPTSGIQESMSWSEFLDRVEATNAAYGYGHWSHHRWDDRFGAKTAQGDASGDGYYQAANGETYWGLYGAAGILARYQETDDNGEPVDDPVFFLQQRAGWTQNGGTWSIPGGALERNEQPVQGAKREFAEETGVGITHSPEVGQYHYRPASDWTYTTIVVDTDEQFTPNATSEATNHGWFTLEEIKQLDLHPAFRASLPDLARYASLVPQPV